MTKTDYQLLGQTIQAVNNRCIGTNKSWNEYYSDLLLTLVSEFGVTDSKFNSSKFVETITGDNITQWQNQ